jgi:cell division protease FtsH
LRYNENQQEVFLGHAITQRQNMSEDTARLIDLEIRRIVTEGETKARDIVTSHRQDLEAITQALMEYETITGEEVNTLIRGDKIVRKSDDEGPKDVGSSAVPSAGARLRPRGEPGTGGMEPQPQA